MNSKKGLMTYAPLLYLISITIIYVSIAVAIYVNDWFRWTKNALSDLGSPYAQYPGIFNIGLIVGGILGIPFMIALFMNFKGKITKVGAIFGFTNPPPRNPRLLRRGGCQMLKNEFAHY